MAIKTLHLTNAYHATSGGIRTFYRALLARANEEQRPCRLVVPGAVDGVEEVGAFARIYTVKARSSPVFDSRYRLLLPPTYLTPGGRLREILAHEQPDLVEICDKYSLFYLAALLRKEWLTNVKRPTLIGLSCERMDDNVSAYVSSGRAGRAVSRAYIRHLYGPPFDAHVANSEYTASELRRSLWDRSPDFIHVCPMGVEVAAFGPVHRDRQLRRRLLAQAGGTADSVLLFYAGRLSPEKNLGLLIDMLDHLQRPTRGTDVSRDYRLVLAGDGPMTEAILKDAAHRVPHRVHWVGAIRDRAELAAHYASADVFVHPNPKEPFGIGPLEAMASRVPVVLPSAGGVLSYANPTNAWLAEPVGASFAHAVRTVLSRPDDGRVAAAFETARHLDWSQVTARFFKLYDQLHRRRQASPSAEAGPIPLRLVSQATHDFALTTSVSHRIVTGLGHSALQESEVTE
ncbi:MAG: glycosyltransferase [Acidobacteriota bacterium]|nr:glycosyltransferase [Acidobacteriota bacterium]